MLQSNIISNLNKTLRSNFASPLDGSGGGGPVVPTIEFVASTIKGGSQSIATTDAIDTTGADLLIAASSYYSDVGAIVDSKGNTWTKLTEYTQDTQIAAIWYCYPTSVGAGHTVSQNVGYYSSVAFYAFKNCLPAGYDKQSGATSAAATTLAAGSLTPSLPNSLVFTLLANYTNEVAPTYPSGFTGGLWAPYNSGYSIALGCAYKILTDAAAVNPSWTWPTSTVCVVADAIFKPQNS